MQIFEASYAMAIRARRYNPDKVVLQGIPTRNDDSDTDGPFSVETLKVF